jgi:hypothetical protein
MAQRRANTMIVSFDRLFLFVHVPKTGGTSIRLAISPYAHHPETCGINRALSCLGISVNRWFGDYRHFRFRTHDPLCTALRLYPRELRERMFKFSFVRNPWDLLASYRFFICATPRHKRHRRIAHLSFSDYLEFAIAKQMGRQLPFLVDEQGRIGVDFVGRFENLQCDFSHVAQRLGIPGRLPHLNRGVGRDYREYYTRRTRDLVRDAYAEDIETFGYEFDRSTACIGQAA